eukprot:UN15547
MIDVAEELRRQNEIQTQISELLLNIKQQQSHVEKLRQSLIIGEKAEAVNAAFGGFH